MDKILPPSSPTDSDLLAPDLFSVSSPAPVAPPSLADENKTQDEATVGDLPAPGLGEVPPHLLRLEQELKTIDEHLKGETRSGMNLEDLVSQGARYACKQIASGRRMLQSFKLPTHSRAEWTHKLVEYTKLPVHICAAFMVARDLSLLHER